MGAEPVAVGERMSYPAGSLQYRLLAGDEEALDLVRRWVAEALTAARYWRLRADWKDLQQEVVLGLFQSLQRERFRPDGEFKSYVQAICRHRAQDRLSEQARRPAVDAPFDPAGTPSRVDDEGLMITGDLVRRILDDSSADCREMIRAYFAQGMTYAELAAHLEVPIGTAKSRLFRCLQCLRDSMAHAAPERAVRERVSE